MSWHAFLPQVFKLPTIGLVPSTFVCLSDFSSILLLKLRYIFVDNTYQKHDLIFLVYGKYYNKKNILPKVAAVFVNTQTTNAVCPVASFGIVHPQLAQEHVCEGFELCLDILTSGGCGQGLVSCLHWRLAARLQQYKNSSALVAGVLVRI